KETSIRTSSKIHQNLEQISTRTEPKLHQNQLRTLHQNQVQIAFRPRRNLLSETGPNSIRTWQKAPSVPGKKPSSEPGTNMYQNQIQTPSEPGRNLYKNRVQTPSEPAKKLHQYQKKNLFKNLLKIFSRIRYKPLSDLGPNSIRTKKKP
ncbi:hypothetical protein AMECASPLE_039483, partial [Ameca splendens]